MTFRWQTSKRGSTARRRRRTGLFDRLELRDLLSLVVIPVNTTEGTSLTDIDVATFSSTDLPGGQPSDYSATIDWGNGQVDTGNIVAAGSGFEVQGSNIYRAPSSPSAPFIITVTVTNSASPPASISASGSAVVATATLTSAGMNVTATQNATFTGPVAAFTDANPYVQAGNFTASINWGDATAASTGVVATAPVTSSGANFTVQGSHIYAAPGSYTISTTITYSGGAVTIANGTAVVTAVVPAIKPIAQLVLATPDVPLPSNTAVGSFTYNPPSGSPAPVFAASIAWGDTQTSSGTVTEVGTTNQYVVTGSHTYTSPGNDTINITVQDGNGNSGTIKSTAIVSGPVLTPISVPITATVGQALPADTRVASFLDANPNDTTSTLQATINWGDGHTTPGTVVQSATVNGFDVEGTHTYTMAGPMSVVVTLTNNTGQSAVATSPAVVTGPAIVATGNTFAVTPGIISSPRVATFTDLNSSATAGNILASINWGDGSSSVGTVTGPDPNGVFTVTGTHTYIAPPSSGSFSVTVTITDPTGQMAMAMGVAVVATPTISATGIPFATALGVVASPQVATFTDSNPAANTTNLSAEISWGDGTSSLGTITGPTTNGLFTVSGTHTYQTAPAAGTYPVKVTITDPSGQSTTTTSNATVASPAIVAIGKTFAVTPGVISSPKVATFTDVNSSATAANILASINWGDGSSSVGTVTGPDPNGVFTVTGTHTYVAPPASGSFPVTVNITDPSGQTAMATGTALVATPTLSATGISFATTLGVAASPQVATFTDSNPAATASNLSAVIAWGDGTSSVGTIAGPTANGLFTVTGTHTYQMAPTAGVFAVKVTITDPSGQTTTTTSNASVASPSIVATGNPIQAVPDINESFKVATFTDSNHAATASNLSAVISWGDGSSSSGTVSGPDANGLFSITGTHTYVMAPASGTYQVTVTITDPSGQTAMVTTSATVLVPTVIPIGTTFSASPGVAFSAVTAGFTDNNPAALLTAPTAVIAWGDGTTSNGVVSGPGSNGEFTVVGYHTYLTSSPVGSFPVTVTIVDPSGQTATASSTALLINTGYTFTGSLSPIVNGPYSNFGYTNTNRPVFSGTAPPFSTIQVFARLYGVDATEPLGEAIAVADGSWSLTTGPLAPGYYTVTAIVTPPAGPPSAPALLQNGEPVAVDIRPRFHRHREPAPPRPLPLEVHRHGHDRPEKPSDKTRSHA